MKILRLLAGLLLVSSPALADMSGGTAEILGPGMVNPSTIVTFMIEVTNGSSDGEATSAVHFRFPETFNVLEGWVDDRGQGWSFAMMPSGSYNERSIFYDADDDLARGEILPGQSGTFYIRVAVTGSTDCGIYDIGWKQYGDNQGKNPHYVLSSIPYDVCGIAVEEISFSSVKSLY